MPATKQTRARKTAAAPAPSTQPAKRAAPARKTASSKASPPAATPPPPAPPLPIVSSPSDEITAPSARPPQVHPLHHVEATPRQIEADAPTQPHRETTSAANRDRMRDAFFPSVRPGSKSTP